VRVLDLRDGDDGLNLRKIEAGFRQWCQRVWTPPG
jgi:hypothetical protein